MVRRALAITLLGLVLAGPRIPGAAAEPKATWAWAAIAPDQSVFADLGNALIDRAEKNLRGELRIKRRFGGVLGDELSTLRMCQEGHLEAWGGSLGALISVVPELRSLELPFQFRDLATLRATLRKLRRGRIPKIMAAFERRGLVLVTMGVIGWRDLASTDRPIRTTADLKGLRARSQDSEIHLAMWRALGTVPKATSLNELPAVFDAERFQVLDIPASFLYATSVDSKIRYYTLTHHMPQLAAVVVNKAAWDRLSKEARAHFTDGMEDVDSKGERAAEAFDAELHAMLAKKGVTIIQPTREELQQLAAATRSIAATVEQSSSKVEREIMGEIARALQASQAPGR